MVYAGVAVLRRRQSISGAEMRKYEKQRVWLTPLVGRAENRDVLFFHRTNTVLEILSYPWFMTCVGSHIHVAVLWPVAVQKKRMHADTSASEMTYIVSGWALNSTHSPHAVTFGILFVECLLHSTEIYEILIKRIYNITLRPMNALYE